MVIVINPSFCDPIQLSHIGGHRIYVYGGNAFIIAYRQPQVITYNSVSKVTGGHLAFHKMSDVAEIVFQTSLQTGESTGPGSSMAPICTNVGCVYLRFFKDASGRWAFVKIGCSSDEDRIFKLHIYKDSRLDQVYTPHYILLLPLSHAFVLEAMLHYVFKPHHIIVDGHREFFNYWDYNTVVTLYQIITGNIGSQYFRLHNVNGDGSWTPVAPGNPRHCGPLKKQ